MINVQQPIFLVIFRTDSTSVVFLNDFNYNYNISFTFNINKFTTLKRNKFMCRFVDLFPVI